ncbi:endonuclease [Pikeienuella piscinae]|uniref:Endonuclease n=1 Tax=Pikeienuella piscinae TaxID=2748098 RepID=A0A7M3T5T1_9RHOB|nr:endonuclease/exonuclease/phosphatase family protein [Pikeienuella piscinae]QIE57362.1 endonuclease [Pikeienuella piscinae]
MLKVASYNIRKCVGLDWRRDPLRVATVLGELNADVVTLQEADRRLGTRRGTLQEAKLAEAGLRFAELPDSGGSHGWHGNAILVSDAVEVRSLKRVTLPFLEPRGALMAELAVRGHSFRVIGAHLGLRPINRIAQARAILEALDAEDDDAYEVVMGDFNEWRTRRGCAEILSRRLRQAPTRASFHASRPVARLDRIFASTALRFRRCGVHRSALARDASDHLPIWAELAPRRRKKEPPR